MKKSLGLVLLILGIVVLFGSLATLLVPGLGPLLVPIFGLLMIFLGGLLLLANKPKN